MSSCMHVSIPVLSHYVLLKHLRRYLVDSLIVHDYNYKPHAIAREVRQHIKASVYVAVASIARDELCFPILGGSLKAHYKVVVLTGLVA